MICDIVQYYHIIDYKELSPVLVATLIVGLPKESRVVMAISGQKLTLEQSLLAKISDDLAFIAWAQTEDARKNRNKPKSILQELLNVHSKEKLVSLTADEFDRKWKEMTGG